MAIGSSHGVQPQVTPNVPHYDPRSNFGKLRITWGWGVAGATMNGTLRFWYDSPTLHRSRSNGSAQKRSTSNRASRHKLWIVLYAS